MRRRLGRPHREVDRLPEGGLDADAPFGLPTRPSPFYVQVTLGIPGGDDVITGLAVQHRYEGDIFSGEKRTDLLVVPALSVRVTPGIAMIPADDPLVRTLAAAHFRDDVVDRLDVPVELDLQMDLRRPGSDVISDWQRAPPRRRRHLSAECAEKWKSIRVRDRKHRDLCYSRRALYIETLRVFRRSDSWCQRVTGIGRHVLNCATLRAVLVGRPQGRVDRRLRGVALELRLRPQRVEEQPVDAGEAGVQVEVGLAPPDLPFVVDRAPTELRQDEVAVDRVIEVEAVAVIAPTEPSGR